MANIWTGAQKRKWILPRRVACTISPAIPGQAALRRLTACDGAICTTGWSVSTTGCGIAQTFGLPKDAFESLNIAFTLHAAQ
jgi:hypothetical protein